jgi:predicted MFS family arabinose efflux permease
MLTPPQQLSQLKGKANMTGWRWIFCLEGVLTCLVGVVGYWLLVDFPDSKRKNWSFLGQNERNWIVSRIAHDRGDAKVEPFNLRKFLGAGSDWKIWCYALIFFNSTTMTYSLAYTGPILLMANMGFSVAEAQCLSAPPYVFAGIVMFATAWLGDKYRVRGPVIIINMVLALIGLPLMGWHSKPGVQFLGMFFVTAGANSNIPAVMSFQANNLRGQWKRAFCSSTMVGFGGIGGIAGSLVFREQDKPTGYKPGMYACIACAALNIILVLICDLEFKRQNAKADRGEKLLEAHDVSCFLSVLGRCRTEADM